MEIAGDARALGFERVLALYPLAFANFTLKLACALVDEPPQLRDPHHGEHQANQVNLFHAIAGKARSLIAALDIIVWAVDPEDNLLQSLADYLSGYAEEFFSNTNIACRFKVPVSFPKINLEGRVRHDLLMTVKEALNKALAEKGRFDV